MSAEEHVPKYHPDGPRVAREHFVQLLPEQYELPVDQRGRLLRDRYSALAFSIPSYRLNNRPRGASRRAEGYLTESRVATIGSLAVEGASDEAAEHIPQLDIGDTIFLPHDQADGNNAKLRHTSALFRIKAATDEAGHAIESGLFFNFLEQDGINEVFSNIIPHTLGRLRPAPYEFLHNHGFLYDSDWDFQVRVLEVADLCIGLAQRSAS